MASEAPAVKRQAPKNTGLFSSTDTPAKPIAATSATVHHSDADSAPTLQTT